MSDFEQRSAEIESLESIFPDLLQSKTESQLVFTFEKDIMLTCSLPHDYPSTSPPIFELSGPYLKANEREALYNSLNESYIENIGFPVIFNWISIIQDFIRDSSTHDEEEEGEATSSAQENSLDDSIPEDFDDMNIQHGEVFHDRKSFFQAHLAVVNSKEDVDRVMRILKSNTKIRRATHNIMAYRYTGERNGVEIKYHDCEDDGEHGASSKMLELMERMKANNVIVVVTRWYGGIHLGPDRFRHINNLTRQILMFCCSHVIIAYWSFLMFDLTVTVCSIGMESLATYVFEIEHDIWVYFHIVSTIFWVFGFLGGLEWVRCLTVYAMRLGLVMMISAGRLVGTFDKFSKKAHIKDIVFLYLPIPIFTYFIGIIITFRMCSFSSNRYSGYYDVDDELRLELQKKLDEIDLKED
ncbi:unnamed protein product [Caenorhabditis angaria]|uniref:RWD domain-containing protein n=1 Tax=Caenorhabditis angaria TaxID=860376 RepID=A0A9P1MS46_9PELO|nr:unnamed protein product [Caenorhabditis angaria]